MDKTPNDNEFQQKRDDFYDTPLARQMKENEAVSISHDKAMIIALILALVSCASTLIHSIWIFLLVQIIIHLLMFIAFAVHYHTNVKEITTNRIFYLEPICQTYSQRKRTIKLILDYIIILLLYIVPVKLFGWLGWTMNAWLAGRTWDTSWGSMFGKACHSKLFPWMGATVNAFIAGMLTFLVVTCIYVLCESVLHERLYRLEQRLHRLEPCMVFY